MVFDIKEFAVFDGPGIRTTVFMKGCPLRCAWCHNPEGISPEPQVLRRTDGERLAGKAYEPDELAAILNSQAGPLRDAEGGVTFSGGEPLMQAPFLASVLDRLDDLHVVLDTSGYGDEDVFADLVQRVDLVYYDLKLMDPDAHRRYTGADNGPILRNLAHLGNSARPCVVRVPLVPGITDTTPNLDGIAEAVRCLAGLIRVELLPYNRSAGAKYRACGMDFRPTWNEDREPNVDTGAFAQLGVPVQVM